MQVGLCAFSSGKAQQIQMETFHGHSMISNQLYADLNDACGPWGDDDVKKAKCQARAALEAGGTLPSL